MNKYAIGIDVGGTSVKIGIFSATGNLLSDWSIPTATSNSGSRIVNDIADSLSDFFTSQRLTARDFLGVGVGIPGFIDHVNNRVFEAVNIGWKDAPIGQDLAGQLGIPVWIENDANLAALGEYHESHSKTPQSLLFVTLGTGVGGGIIVEGEIIVGNSGTAGEIGHIIVDRSATFRCNCGRYGCLDTIASTAGITRLINSLMPKYPASSFALAGSAAVIESSDVFRFAFEGDPLALEVVDYVCESLGYALANAAMLLNPAQIVIGGGLSHYGEFFLDKVQAHFGAYVLPRLAQETQVQLATLGNRAGILGAAALVNLRILEHDK